MSKSAVRLGKCSKAGRKETPKGLESVSADERMELVLGRVEEVRAMQRAEGHFDCFGRASAYFCDQRACLFHAECLSVPMLIGQHAL
jgi:hypothetical protein